MSRPNLPLYARVRENLIARIASGEYATGECLPSEIALAEAEGVSPGTVRKAIDSLVADGALRRHQGKGTYVAEHTEARAQYQFLRLTDHDGSRVIPVPATQNVLADRVSAEVAAKLQIVVGAPVWRIERTRLIDGEPALLETIVVDQKLMPGLDQVEMLPNALYPFYQARFGLSVMSTDDALSAVNASSRDAALLGRPEETALLMIERVARDLTGRPLEWRRTRCLTHHHAWAVTLR
ncbi:GntR family transcriptional regulator [Rhodobacteraceae bacterium NNCM2]|nr:GntR family transcriptional regulator [Coraliihabitans acroporae]